MLMMSCGRDEENVLCSNFADESIAGLQKSYIIGKRGYLEIVFPFNFDLPAETTPTGESFEEAKALIQAWKEAN